jgi:hypothetical protein
MERYAPPKRRLTQDLYRATSQKTAFFVVSRENLTPYKYNLLAYFLFIDLLFDCEDGGDMFLRNLWLSQNYMLLQAR